MELNAASGDRSAP